MSSLIEAYSGFQQPSKKKSPYLHLADRTGHITHHSKNRTIQITQDVYKNHPRTVKTVGSLPSEHIGSR